MKGSTSHLKVLVACYGLLRTRTLAHSSENSIYSSDVHPLMQPFTDLHQQVSSTPLHSQSRARIVSPDLDLDIDAAMGAALDDASVWAHKKHDGFDVNSRSRELGNFHSEETLRLNLASSHWQGGESFELESPIRNIRPRESYFLECSTASPAHISGSATSSHLPIGNLKSKYLKTGTTIVGVQTSTHIIIAADTRATEGTVVADTRCDKVHQLASNVWCCGAGTSADLDALTRRIRYTFLLRSKIQDSIGNGILDDEKMEEVEEENQEDQYRSQEERNINQTLGKASIASICTMIREDLYKNGGGIGANLVLGGVDAHTNEPILTAIHPHGSIDRVPYTALGSGGLAAMGVLESRYQPEISLEEAINLVQDAVHAGIKNDLGSGSQVCTKESKLAFFNIFTLNFGTYTIIYVYEIIT